VARVGQSCILAGRRVAELLRLWCSQLVASGKTKNADLQKYIDALRSSVGTTAERDSRDFHVGVHESDAKVRGLSRCDLRFQLVEVGGQALAPRELDYDQAWRLVEAAGIEPASENATQSGLHA
jgi:hypothetical protein